MDHYLKDELYELMKKDSSIFEFIQEGSLDGVWYWDLENPQNEWMSKKFWTELGYDPKEMPHSPDAWQSIIDADDLEIAIDNFHKHLADAKHPYDQIVKYRHKDGSTVYIRCRGLAIRDKHGKATRMLGAHTNVTSLKKLELESLKRESFWRETMEQMNFGFLILDREYRYVFVNEKSEEFSKLPKGYLIGKTMQEVFPNVEETEIYKAVVNVFKTGKSQVITHTFKFPSGEVETYQQAIHPHGDTLWIYTTNTPEQLNQLNNKIKSERNIFKSIFKDENTIKFLIDAQTGNFVDVNNACVNFYGYSYDELMEMKVWDINTMSNDGVFKELNKAQLNQQSHWEFKHKKADGTIVDVEVYATSLEIDGKKLLFSNVYDLTEKKKTEENLKKAQEELTKQKTEELLSNLAENVPGMIYQFQRFPDGSTYLPYSSKKIYDIYGVTLDEVRYDISKIFSNIHPEDVDYVKQSILDSYNSLELWETRMRVIHPDKGEIWIEGKSQPIKQDDGSVLWNGYIHEITEQVKTERELIKISLKEKELADIVRTAPIAIAFGYPDGSLDHTNLAFSELTGYSLEELQKIDWNKTLTPEKWFDFENEKLGKLSPENKSVQYEKEYKTKTGDIIPVELFVTANFNSEGQIINFIGFVWDISDRKQAEQKIKESQAKFESIFNTAHVSIVIVDENGYLFEFNTAAYEHLGYTKEEYSKLHITQIDVPQEKEDVEAKIAEIQQNGFAVFETQHRHKDGRILDMIVYASLVEINNKLYNLAAFHDVTEIKEAESKILQKNKELEQFNYITSHDLQEPLNSIISFTNFIERDRENLNDLSKKSLDIIRASSYRMKNFITSLLEHSRIGKNQNYELVEIENVINDIKIDLFQLISTKHASVQYVGDNIKLKGVKEDIISLFQNLVINAIKYTDNNIKPIVTIGGEERNDDFLFSVNDNGIGIDEKYYDKIFEVFQRLHPRNETSGTGIGLANCKKIVELHGGKIWIESKVGSGSTFYFTISKTKS